MFGSECMISRLVQPEKCEFTIVNDHFEGKHNEDNVLYGQTINQIYGKIYVQSSIKGGKMQIVNPCSIF